MRSINVELRHLRAFVAVAEAANFTRAAQKLLISQPSLSHTIRQLENELGFRLFDRTTRATALTSAGTAFLAEARAVLARFGQAADVAGRLAAGTVGRIRVGYLIGAAVDHVPAILHAFGECYPELDVELVEYNFATPNCGLDTGETDVAIARPPLDPPHLTITTLLTEPCLVCLPEAHPLARREEVSVSVLLGEPMVAAPGSGTWRDIWTLRPQHAGDVTPDIVYEAATFEAEFQAVALGRGLSVVPASAARHYRRPGIRFVPISDLADCEVAVAYAQGASPAAANFARVAAGVVGRAGGSVSARPTPAADPWPPAPPSAAPEASPSGPTP